MKYFYFALLPTLACIKIVLQGYFSKGKIKSAADSLKLNGFMFMFSAITLIIFTVRSLPSLTTIIFSLCLALLTVGFQFFFAYAFKAGPVSLSVTINNFSNTLPIVFSIIFFSAPISLSKILSFVFMAIAFVLISSKDESGVKTSKVWFLLILLATTFNGFSSITQVCFSKSSVASESAVFTATTYVFATTLCFLLIPFFKKGQPLFKMDKKLTIGLPFIGLSLGFFNFLVIEALKIIPETVYYPTVSSLILLFNVIASVILFKEKLSIKQAMAIGIVLLSIVLANV